MDFAVPMSGVDFGAEEQAAVATVLKSGILSQGEQTRAFETAVADYVGTRHGVAVSSGTAALHLCVRAAEVGEGDAVITTPFGFVASANAILYERARPVFVDIDEESMNIDPARVADAMTPDVRAILPVHVFGQPADMDALTDIAGRANAMLIEDACEALGSDYRGRRVGSFGQTGCFSFFANKQIATGEGAVITTNDDDVAALLVSKRNQGRAAMGAWLVHERLGYNYRITEMSAALGAVQMERIEAILARREAVATAYRRRLDAIAGVRMIAPLAATTRLSWFAAVVRLDPAINRDRVVAELAAAGIPSRTYFNPIHLQPLYRRLFGYRGGEFPVAERVARSTLALPFFTRMSADQIDLVCDRLADVLAHAPS